MTRPAIPTVVAYRALGLGDFLTGIPALRALKREWPHHRLVLAAPAWLRELALFTGVVDAFSPTAPLADLEPRFRRADVVVNLHGRGPDSHRAALRSSPDRLLAFHHPDVPETSGAPEWRADEHEVDRWCRLLTESGIPADPADLRIESPEPAAAGAGVTIVHPGAGSEARRWPAELWADVVRALAADGRRVVVTGSAGEASLARSVAGAAGLPATAVFAGTTDLLALAALVGGAAAVVSGDTGIAHLATALGTRSVTLFGPTPPDLWGPRIDLEIHISLWTGGCGNPHAARPDAGLLGITPSDVLAALSSWSRVQEAV